MLYFRILMSRMSIYSSRRLHEYYTTRLGYTGADRAHGFKMSRGEHRGALSSVCVHHGWYFSVRLQRAHLATNAAPMVDAPSSPACAIALICVHARTHARTTSHLAQGSMTMTTTTTRMMTTAARTKTVAAFVHTQMGGSEARNTACCNWSAESLHLSHYSRAMYRGVRACARTLRNAPPPSWVVGVGTALAGNIGACVCATHAFDACTCALRICVCAYACIRVYLRISRETPFAERSSGRSRGADPAISRRDVRARGSPATCEDEVATNYRIFR